MAVRKDQLWMLSKLDQDLYNAGQMSDAEAQALIDEKMQTSVPQGNPNAVGPPTLEDQARIAGILDVEDDVRTPAAAARNQIAGSLTDVLKGEILRKSETTPLSSFVSNIGNPVGMLSDLAWQDLYDKGARELGIDTERGIKVDKLIEEGRQLARQHGLKDANALTKWIAENGSNAVQMAPLVASALKSRGATVALSTIIPGTMSSGGNYLESRRAGQSVESSQMRATTKSLAEQLLEGFVPGGGSLSAMKNFVGRTFGEGLGEAVQDQVGQGIDLAGGALDNASRGAKLTTDRGDISLETDYGDFVPKTWQDSVTQTGKSAIAGAVFGGAAAGVTARKEAKDVFVNEWLKPGMAQFEKDRVEALKQIEAVAGPNASDFAKGAAIDAEIMAKAQGDLFGDLPTQVQNDVSPWKVPETFTKPKLKAQNQQQEVLPLATDLTKDLRTNQMAPKEQAGTVAEFRAKQAKAAEASVKKEAAAKKAYVNTALKTAIKANPNITDAELGQQAAKAGAAFQVEQAVKQRKAQAEAAKKVGTTTGPTIPTNTTAPVRPVATTKRTPIATPTAKPPTPAPVKTQELGVLADGTRVNSGAKVDPNNLGGLTEEEFIRSIASDNKTNKAVRDAWLQGKVKVVTDKSDPASRGTNGSFDGKTLYLNRDNLTKDNVVAVAMHEVKHYYDAQDRTDKSKSLQNILGIKANDKLIAKIQSLAPTNSIAKKAVERYETARKVNPRLTLPDEIVTYFIEESKIARERGGSLGRAGGVMRDIVSDAKTFMRDKLGADLNVSENDLVRLTEQLVRGLPKDNKKPTGSTMPKLSVVGDSAVNAERYRKEGRLFKGAVDGKNRYELDTSKIKYNDFRGYQVTKGNGTYLGALLDFPELYENYPEFKNIKVYKNKGDMNSPGRADLKGRAIYMSEETLRDPEKAKSTLLHEIQHQIQAKEGFVNGAAPSEFLTPEDQKSYQSAKESLEEIINSVDADTIESLRDKIPARFQNRLDTSADVLLYAETQIDPRDLTPDERSALAQYSPARKAFGPEFKKYDAAYQKYKRVAGEAEARAVQRRMKLTPSERAETGFYQSLDVPKDELIDNADPSSGSQFADARARQREQLSTRRNSVAAPREDTKTPEFRRWFKDSKVTNEDGSPRIMYHGTTANFTTFKPGERDMGMHFGTKNQSNHPRFLEKYDSHGQQKPPHILPVYLSIQNPLRTRDIFGRGIVPAAFDLRQAEVFTQQELEQVLDVYDSKEAGNTTRAWREMERIIKSKGYDGIVYENVAESHRGKIEDSYVIFDPNQVKSATGNSGQFSPESNDIRQSVAVPTQVDLTHSKENNFGARRPTPVVIGRRGKTDILLAPDTVSGKIVDVIKKGLKGRGVPDSVISHVDRAAGAQSEAQLEALTAMNAINKELGKLPDTDAAYDFIKFYEQSKTREERVERAAMFQKRYPGLFAAYNAARGQMYNFSQKIITDLEAMGDALSNEQKEIITAIRENLGNYTTRSYALFGPGQISRAHRGFLLKTDEGKKIVAGAKSWAMNEVVDIPENLEDQERPKLEALYDMWVPGSAKAGRTANQVPREELESMLSELQGTLTTDALSREADKFVNDLMTVGIRAQAIGKMAKIYRGERQDLTIITPRTGVPDVLKELWGEQKDPVMNVFTTLIRQGEFVARIQQQWDMLNTLGGEVFFDNSSSGPNGTELVQLEGEEFGPLRGKFTTPDVKQYLDLKTEADNSFGAWLENVKDMDQNDRSLVSQTAATLAQLAGTAGGKLKWLAVVTNPVNAAMNFGGAYGQMLMNGNFLGKNGVKGLKIAMRQMPGVAYKTKATDFVKELVRNGVLDSALVGEIQTAELNAMVDKFLRTGVSAFSRTGKNKATSYMTDLYAGSDLWAKVANYYTEKDFIKNFYETLGEPKSEDEIQRIASDRIKQTNFSFRHAWAPAKALEAGGITNYLTYNAEVFRSIIGNFKLAAGDLAMANSLLETNPEAAAMLKNKATRRFVGAMTATAGHTMLLKAVGSMVSLIAGMDEGEEEEAIKRGLPNWHGDKILKLIGVDANGVREYFDVSRIDPIGPINELSRGVIRSLENKDPQPAWDAFKNLFILNQALDVFAQNMDITRQKDPALAKAAPTLYDNLGNVLADLPGINETGEGLGISSKTFLKLAEVISPSFIETPFGAVGEIKASDKSMGRLIAQGLGLKTIKYDPRTDTAGTIRNEYSSPVNDMRSDWSNYVRVNSDLTAEEITTKFKEMADAEYRVWAKSREKIKAAQLAGATHRQLSEVLKAEKAANQEQVNSLLTGKFSPTVLSQTKWTADKASEIQEAKSKNRHNKVADIEAKYKLIDSTLPKLIRTYKIEE